MGDVVNLNKFRKARQRQAEERRGAINREKFGRTKAETRQGQLFRDRHERALDARRLESDARKGRDRDADKDKR